MSWKSKLARRQISEEDLLSGMPPQTGLTFNVWYNKWSHGPSSSVRFVSPFRLDPTRDSGKTRAADDAFYCLYFARGCCVMGSKCEYLHHVPEEETSFNDIKDCFGRDKFAEYRDDMGGVGSFRKRNRTLYIGGLAGALNNKTLKPTQIESRLRFMFNKLGPIDKIRYVANKNCAFVKFRNARNAEFAKEAMTNQTMLLPNDDEWENRTESTGLLVKWANDDPDPEARRQEEEQTRVNSIHLMEKLLQNFGNSKRQRDDASSDASPIASSDTTPRSISPRNPRSDLILAAIKKLKSQRNDTALRRLEDALQPKQTDIKAALTDYTTESDED
ncbi:hypothetical protein KAFR_0H01620 [Kazachstania africana CBS 2517]|uniref:Pre-mRNA-splicing factor CWC2 n=1 Tax=Kazachstania africana (strain ATCC 22294 / BCRC 22015 / CBS 2517 / CECT 1963 / NBRC 1671 / NRRL Y-8276) TaxID=1071382 RepID=H2AZ16_KAZAF|nr:hypothetical protein KAFR_0H01620 [Kazachstania africana CBS 2517]CCF59572.1 hypothetical protein KAFR_0H01620 [Kazachstania africana CBS 2517]